jgi:hypothetical protein
MCRYAVGISVKFIFLAINYADFYGAGLLIKKYRPGIITKELSSYRLSIHGWYGN